MGSVVLTVISSLALVIGAGVFVGAYVYLPGVIGDGLDDAVKLPTKAEDADDSKYQQWVRNDQADALPVYEKYYMYNILNQADVLAGEPAEVEELGPYSYRMYTFKEEVSWNADKTEVSFKERTVWHFDEATSGAGLSENDMVTNVNAAWFGFHAATFGMDSVKQMSMAIAGTEGALQLLTMGGSTTAKATLFTTGTNFAATPVAGNPPWTYAPSFSAYLSDFAAGHAVSAAEAENALYLVTVTASTGPMMTPGGLAGFLATVNADPAVAASLWGLDSSTEALTLANYWGGHAMPVYGHTLLSITASALQTKTVHQWLFDYEDGMLELLGSDPQVAVNSHNGTLDATFMTLNTGEKDVNKAEQVIEFEGSTEVVWFPGAANEAAVPVNKFPATLGSRSFTKHEATETGDLNAWSRLLKRAFWLEGTGDNEDVFGIECSRFELKETNFETAADNSDNEPYAQDLEGYLRLAGVRSGSPIYGSKAHFLDVPTSTYNVTGVTAPSRTADDSYLLCEKQTGLALDTAVRTQNNLFTTPGDTAYFTTMYDGIIPFYYLIADLAARESDTEDLAAAVSLLNTSQYAAFGGAGLAAFGLIGVLISVATRSGSSSSGKF